MKFCCEHFKFRIQGESNMGLNIIIVKLSKEYINESEKRGFPVKKDELYNFILTEGYVGKLTNKGQSIFINYCPFCGKKLQKHYAKDEYVNEENHIW